MSLQGKVAIVTGSGRGIGAAVALALAQQGASVVIDYVSTSSRALAEGVAKSISELPLANNGNGNGTQQQQVVGDGKTLVVQADMAKLEDIDRLVKVTVERFGKIDILVNNGGLLDDQPVGQITPEVYQKVFDVNVRGVIFMSQAVVPHMKEGGRIINLSSIVARLAMPGSTVYAASKVAVEAITRVMGVELRSRNIRVTAVNPGPTSTDMFANLPDEHREAIRSMYPVGEPSDIADVIVFLAGPQARWINAVTVGTNNGVVLN